MMVNEDNLIKTKNYHLCIIFHNCQGGKIRRKLSVT